MAGTPTGENSRWVLTPGAVPTGQGGRSCAGKLLQLIISTPIRRSQAFSGRRSHHEDELPQAVWHMPTEHMR
jgi:hypothetical protein